MSDLQIIHCGTCQRVTVPTALHNGMCPLCQEDKQKEAVTLKQATTIKVLYVALGMVTTIAVLQAILPVS